MTTREEFEAWARSDIGMEFIFEKDEVAGLCNMVAFKAWQASRAETLEEAAKECDEMQAMWERQARGGDNTGASDFRADAAEQCAMGIRALK